MQLIVVSLTDTWPRKQLLFLPKTLLSPATGPMLLSVLLLQAENQLYDIYAQTGECHCLCRLEVLEAATCTLLSCNIAWHADADRKDPNKCSTIHYAVNDTLSALDAVQIPAAPAAPAFQVRQGTFHCPYRNLQGKSRRNLKQCPHEHAVWPHYVRVTHVG